MAAKRNPSQQPKRIPKPYRDYGFRSQQSYASWVKKYSSLPESDPRYFDKSLRGGKRGREINRLKVIIKRSGTAPKEVRRKMNLLVYDMDKMSAFNFLDRYLAQIQAMLHDPSVSQYDKRILRGILKRLQSDSDVNAGLQPGDQLHLFG